MIYNEKTKQLEHTLPTEYQSFIHKSRYARWLPKENRREEWEETVDRYLDFFDDKLDTKTKHELRTAILTLEVMPSMRCLMTAGEALSKDNVAGYNCAFVAVDHPRVFDEILYVLMCGTGVGFSVERQFVSKLSEIAEEFHPTETVIEVADSKIGWAKGLKQLISLLWQGEVPKWDLTKLRPAGAPLKTFGGRSSGPEPLNDLFKFTVDMFKKAKGRKLSSLECHDLVCKIADIVVVGGVRRSALISLSNVSDDRMRGAKTGQWWVENPQRALANNSACYNEKPEFEVFLNEWKALYESKCGERGIFSRYGAKKIVAKSGRRDPDYEWGCNPCCFTKDMQLLTLDGYQDIGGLVYEDSVELVNKDGTVTTGKVWSSGIKPVVSLNFSARLQKDSITCTPDHVFMLSDGTECAAENTRGKRLMPYYYIKDEFVSEEVLAGFILGDGSLNRLNSDRHRGLEVYFGKKDGDVAKLFGQEAGSVWYSNEAYEVAKKYNLEASIIGHRGGPQDPKLLTGLFSANGSVIAAGRVALKSIDKMQILDVQSMLKMDYGISSHITTNKAKKVKFSNGEYLCKESYDLNIAEYESLLTFASMISFVQEYKREALEKVILKRAPYVESVKECGEEEVFDFTEPETHWGVVNGVVVHNSEILLRPSGQMCNLSEVVVREYDTFETLKNKVRLATILGTLQSSLVDFRYLRSIWRKNTEEEALLGVSLTGIMDHPVLSTKVNVKDSTAFNGFADLDDLLDKLKLVSIDTNGIWAKKIGVNPSTAITCVKPSGTVSQLVDSASGIHTRYSKHYIRRVRIDAKDPLCQFMIDKGFPHEQDVMNSATMVFSFPTAAPKGCVDRNGFTAIEQLELWKTYQEAWCEHKPSITVYYKDDEFFEVGAWVWKNFDYISGVSFLPYSDHTYQQAPYEEIDEQTYTTMLEAMPSDTDWSMLGEFEKEDSTVGSQTYACSGNSCELVDITK